MNYWKVLAAALITPLALAACLLLPGKFQSTLTIHADRSFSYAYKGEIIATDALETTSAENFTDDGTVPDPTEAAAEKARKEAVFREVAAKMAKETGYRSVAYRGDGVFDVDYEISGKLTHNFVFPYNQDAKMIFPFFAIELRGKDLVRVQAPGFAARQGPDHDGSNSRLDGTFTLITDAEIVSQNHADGARPSGGNNTIRWKVTPDTDIAPTVVLKVEAL
ncbi:hypothetical protein [Sphingomonas psychrotolerans]|uniref:Lipoprotein n=1 Tax=Sphingomonas psychrotolerans TaxID=1327635 RepID=A0A2K8MFF5_9SPHN|nr:hypothetical protein [Sphingomonas psychrotolerans]ATY32622.1 hypothetical protein CVN68_12090 [Sphingomonas psychrotolerans]